tara:strand:- start:3536 stop:4123 length:588 start_codon:yes stop_codon:yes gene_type:complete
MKKQKKLNKKRRLENKTNYTKRLILLKGDYLRLVIRKSNKYITLQIVESENAKDKVLYSVNSRELLKHGWPEDKTGSLKSLAAGYLSGLLLGKKAKELKKPVILDSGLIPNTKGSRVYSAVKGFADSGIEIKYDKKVIPSEERIKNNYEFFEKVQNSLGVKNQSKTNNAQKDSSEEQKKSEKSNIDENKMEEVKE